MNYSTAIFLINDDVRAVACAYEAQDGAKTTVFKTMDPDIKVDDYVVVPTTTRHNMTVVRVREVDLDIDFEDDAEVKWIVGTVSREDFEQLTEVENDAIEKMKRAQRRKKRTELREALMADHDAEVKALPIYTAANGDEPPAVEPPPDGPVKE